MIIRDKKSTISFLTNHNGYAATPTAVGEVKNSIEIRGLWLVNNGHVTNRDIDFIIFFPKIFDINRENIKISNLNHFSYDINIFFISLTTRNVIITPFYNSSVRRLRPQKWRHSEEFHEHYWNKITESTLHWHIHHYKHVLFNLNHKIRNHITFRTFIKWIRVLFIRTELNNMVSGIDGNFSGISPVYYPPIVHSQWRNTLFSQG